MQADADPQHPENLAELEDAVRQHLLPGGRRPGRRAHQYTVNGFTYPFLRHSGFAGVLNPGEATARYADILAGLHMSRPRDLLFLFSAEPRPNTTRFNRRGIHGIYEILSTPFYGPAPFIDPVNGYRILGSCPGGCGRTHSRLPRGADQYRLPPCPCCGAEAPASGPPYRGHPYPDLLVPWRLEVAPWVLFDAPVTDERVYSDWEDAGTVWVGRHDNQSIGTGRGGKGSSIRQLTTEEAVKLARLLKKEAEAGEVNPGAAAVPYTGDRLPITNTDGSPVTHPRVNHRPRAGDIVHREFDVSLAMATHFDDPAASLAAALGIVDDLPNLEYASAFYPWGYTNATCDFVLRFVRERRVYKIVIVETKQDDITDGAIDSPGAIVQLADVYPLGGQPAHNQRGGGA